MFAPQTNEKGQVTVKSSVLHQIEDLKEETGLVCSICREGYRYQPNKVIIMIIIIVIIIIIKPRFRIHGMCYPNATTNGNM